jgi:Holliday junction resolvase RusA-like endonuclease
MTPPATEFNIPILPPSANRLWRVGNGRIYKSTEYKNWLDTMGYIVQGQRPRPIEGPYKLTIGILRPHTTRDLDNNIKPINDLIAGLGIVANDRDCELLNVRWLSNAEGITVRVERAGLG